MNLHQSGENASTAVDTRLIAGIRPKDRCLFLWVPHSWDRTGMRIGQEGFREVVVFMSTDSVINHEHSVFTLTFTGETPTAVLICFYRG